MHPTSFSIHLLFLGSLTSVASGAPIPELVPKIAPWQSKENLSEVPVIAGDHWPNFRRRSTSALEKISQAFSWRKGPDRAYDVPPPPESENAASIIENEADPIEIEQIHNPTETQTKAKAKSTSVRTWIGQHLAPKSIRKTGAKADTQITLDFTGSFRGKAKQLGELESDLEAVRHNKAGPETVARVQALSNNRDPMISEAADVALGHRALMRLNDQDIRDWAAKAPPSESRKHLHDDITRVKILEFSNSDPDGQTAAKRFLDDWAIDGLKSMKGEAPVEYAARARAIAEFTTKDGLAAKEALALAAIDHVKKKGGFARKDMVKDVENAHKGSSNPEIKRDAGNTLKVYNKTMKEALVRSDTVKFRSSSVSEEDPNWDWVELDTSPRPRIEGESLQMPGLGLKPSGSGPM